jgi:hypothetical protein
MDLKETALNKTNKRHPWEIAREKVVACLINRMLPKGKKEISVFDIGSGDLFLITELSKKITSTSFFAVDTGYLDGYIETTNKNLQTGGYNIKVFNSLTAAEQAAPNSIDLVLLLDVIEHVPDDVSFLKELNNSSKINEQTIFLITVPAFQFLFCSHDVFLDHFRRYNNQLLKRNLSNSGLNAIEIGYFFLFPLFARILRVVYEKAIPSKKATGISNWTGSYWWSRFLVWMLLADFFITDLFHKLKIRLPGLSNYAVCKKFV